MTADGNASNLVQNDGTLTIHADASANGVTSAYATAYVNYAISQTAYADDGNATNTVSNGGTLDITAVANANAASGYGIRLCVQLFGSPAVCDRDRRKCD